MPLDATTMGGKTELLRKSLPFCVRTVKVRLCRHASGRLLTPDWLLPSLPSYPWAAMETPWGWRDLAPSQSHAPFRCPQCSCTLGPLQCFPSNRSSEVGSPCRGSARPSSEVGSPCRSLAGPSSEVGSPCRSFAGPSSEVGSPCRSLAGPSSEVGSLIYTGGGRPPSKGLDFVRPFSRSADLERARLCPRLVKWFLRPSGSKLPFGVERDMLFILVTGLLKTVQN